LLALLTNEAEPLTPPLACGAKLIVTCCVSPAGIVTGKTGDVTANPDPVVLAEKTFTLEFPVFVKVAFLVLLLPTATFPNERLKGEALTVKIGTAVAVPDIPIGAMLFVASLVITRLPA
jgi:hypothetical protein